MITDDRVKEFLKKNNRPGKRSNSKKNQELLLTSLFQIKDTMVHGFPEEDVLTEYMQIEGVIAKIISETLEALTPIYE